MADIFISYAHEDRRRVQALAEALSAHGLSVRRDRQIQAGETFDEVITEALGAARCVVVVWSRESITSNWVREEAEEGRRRGILIPVLIDAVRPPLGFSRIQTVELWDWTGEVTSDAFQQLLRDTTAILGPPRAEVSETGPRPSLERSPASRQGPVLGKRRLQAAAAALAHRTHRATRALERIVVPGNHRVKWSFTALFVVAILLFLVSRLPVFHATHSPTYAEDIHRYA